MNVPPIRELSLWAKIGLSSPCLVSSSLDSSVSHAYQCHTIARNKERRAGSAAQSVQSVNSYATTAEETGDELLEARESRVTFSFVRNTHSSLRNPLIQLLQQEVLTEGAEKKKR